MGGGAVGHATRWRADATRSTPEACGRAPLPGNPRHRLRAELAVGISRPGAGRRVTVAKVGVRLAGLWEPRTPSSRTSDLVPDSRLDAIPELPSLSQRPRRPSSVARPPGRTSTHRPSFASTCLGLGHAPVQDWPPTRARRGRLPGSPGQLQLSSCMPSEQLSFGSAGLAIPRCKAGRR